MAGSTSNPALEKYDAAEIWHSVAQSISWLSDRTADLGQQVAVHTEEIERVNDDIRGNSDLQEVVQANTDYADGLRQTAENLNTSAQILFSAQDEDTFREHAAYIEQAATSVGEPVANFESSFDELPENVQSEHREAREHSGTLWGACQVIAEGASAAYGWWQSFVQARDPVDLRDPAQAGQLTQEDINSRGHWRDLANAAPENSVGSLAKTYADRLYPVVGEVAGQGIGATFENNKELFYQVNETPQDMAAAIVQWAAYETTAIQTEPSADLATKVVGAVLSQSDRAALLWSAYKANQPDGGESLADDPYEVANMPKPPEDQVYRQIS
jgi:hypothetical protein